MARTAAWHGPIPAPAPASAAAPAAQAAAPAAVAATSWLARLTGADRQTARKLNWLYGDVLAGQGGGERAPRAVSAPGR